MNHAEEWQAALVICQVEVLHNVGYFVEDTEEEPLVLPLKKEGAAKLEQVEAIRVAGCHYHIEDGFLLFFGFGHTPVHRAKVPGLCVLGEECRLAGAKLYKLPYLTVETREVLISYGLPEIADLVSDLGLVNSCDEVIRVGCHLVGLFSLETLDI